MGYQPRTCRPRTRGDLPSARSRMPSGPSSSPHARGSSRRPPAARWCRSVVPARAGIFPLLWIIQWRVESRPRTRGDLPVYADHGHDIAASSPHARGSSLSHLPLRPRRCVVPARAGIFPRFRWRGWCAGRRPRTRGDLPGGLSGARLPEWSSPHARGSSGMEARIPQIGQVVPARAGIFHRMDPLAYLDAGSSPHARGSSPARGGWEFLAIVVPARAGIFQPPRRWRPQAGRRPRTRGDLPSCASAEVS